MYVLIADENKFYSLKGYTRGAWIVFDCAKSRNFGSVRGRRHAFRLHDAKGKIRYRGYAVFPDTADYGAILRPLVDFGCKHGCNQISYKVGKRYSKIPLETALRFTRYCGIDASTREFLDFYDLNNLTEADEDQLQRYIEYVTEA